MADIIQRFIFDSTDIRGQLVRLQNSYRDCLDGHNYPPAVAMLLGEFLAAAALLSSTLKFEGSLILQARSEGSVSLIMAEANSEQQLRAITRCSEKIDNCDFRQLLHNGQLSITIEPRQGKRYQGIVSLDGDCLATCLKSYFSQSEQLPTRLWLQADQQTAAGMFLQALPADQQTDPRQRELDWEHLGHLAETTTREELLTLPFDKLLYRLFHEEQTRVFEPSQLCFHCSCSRERTGRALTTLDPVELEELLISDGHITLDCEFCQRQYRFERADIQELLKPTLH